MVSPTWFRLGAIQVRSKTTLIADMWIGLIPTAIRYGRCFPTPLTRIGPAPCCGFPLRDQVIAQMLVYAEVYSLDGINIDFENVYQKTPLFDPICAGDDSFSPDGFDRLHGCDGEILEPYLVSLLRENVWPTLDYIMLMAYDQYGELQSGGSQRRFALDGVDHQDDSRGGTQRKTCARDTVLRQVVERDPIRRRSEGHSEGPGMKAARDWMAAEKVVPHLDEDSGMEYAQKKSGPDTYRIWLENAESVRKRLELAKTYDLAGVAAWSRVFADSETWRVMEEFLLRD